MANSKLAFDPGWQARDANGALSGALIDFFLAETTTPVNVYSDADLENALPNPVVCNSGGFPTSDGNAECCVYVGTQAYRMRVRRSDGTTVRDLDNLQGADVAAASTQGFEIGLVIPSAFFTAPSSRWLPFNGGTIGSANSGASLRASDSLDTAATYAGLWAYGNTQVPILDSAGNPTTRGGSPGDDFAANKRLTLLDACGRAIFFADNMAGVASKNRLTGLSGGIDGDIPGYSGGNEKFNIGLAKLPVIDMDTYKTDPGHPHTVTTPTNYATPLQGGGGGSAWNGTTTTNTGSATTGVNFSTFGSGEDTPHLPPGIVLPLLLIYAGNP